MAEFVQKELCGSMFKNQKKLTEQHPNMTGNKWQSLSFNKKEPKTRAQADLAVSEIDNDVPF